jgi:hypothetical protein
MTRGMVAIVKDERERIDACLTACERAGITVGTIVDTGSTDGTPQHIREAYPWCRVVRRKWRNFGHNRSQAFALARGSADWLVALDADMTVEWDDGWEPDPLVNSYALRMGDRDCDWRLPLLLRGDLPWRSVGAVHEYTCLPGGVLPHSVATDHVRVPYIDRGREPAKTLWQAGMLEEDLAREPDNPRTVFYLAQCRRELGDTVTARDLYARRATMDNGWEEEQWYAGYRVALLTPEWNEQLPLLLASWEARPHRLEPLYIAVRELNRRDLHRTAWGLVNAVDQHVTPDSLFVQRSVWEWGMSFERSIAAWWVGRHDECREISQRLLEHPGLPDYIRPAIERNLTYCEVTPWAA